MSRIKKITGTAAAPISASAAARRSSEVRPEAVGLGALMTEAGTVGEGVAVGCIACLRKKRVGVKLNRSARLGEPFFSPPT